MRGYSSQGRFAAKGSRLGGVLETGPARFSGHRPADHGVYVPHAFQKKSRRGSATPRQDMELIRNRLEMARQFREQRRDTGKGELR